MRTKFALILLGAVLLGCAAPHQVNYAPSSTSSTSQPATVAPFSDVCVFEADHSSSEGIAIQAGYFCATYLAGSTSPATLARASPPSVAVPPGISNSYGVSCSYLAAYTRSDGRSAGPYVRCVNYADAYAYYSSHSSSKLAPCVSSNCGPVYVKGYYRKDGTYVRGHTRRK
jgi:hypothetical protein